jgi:IS30 family transposase
MESESSGRIAPPISSRPVVAIREAGNDWPVEDIERTRQYLNREWSPRQIAGWLKRTYPNNENFQVSHETIYRTLFIQARGALKKELLQHLRRTRVMRRSRHHTQKTVDHGRIKDAVWIRERPPEVEDRSVPGHWEGHLLSRSNNSHIATLVERKTRYVMLVKVKSKDT